MNNSPSIFYNLQNQTHLLRLIIPHSEVGVTIWNDWIQRWTPGVSLWNDVLQMKRPLPSCLQEPSPIINITQIKGRFTVLGPAKSILTIITRIDDRDYLSYIYPPPPLPTHMGVGLSCQQETTADYSNKYLQEDKAFGYPSCKKKGLIQTQVCWWLETFSSTQWEVNQLVGYPE